MFIHFQEHIKDIKSLRAKDIPLVEEMKEVGLKVLRDQGGDVEKVHSKKVDQANFYFLRKSSII